VLRGYGDVVGKLRAPMSPRAAELDTFILPSKDSCPQSPSAAHISTNARGPMAAFLNKNSFAVNCTLMSPAHFLLFSLRQQRRKTRNEDQPRARNCRINRPRPLRRVSAVAHADAVKGDRARSTAPVRKLP
jgi:hypothetical protein